MKPVILVVDDFASVRLYHMGFLGRKGFDCVGAASAAAALEVLRQRPVDLVLLDMLMPEMDGGGFVARLDALPALSRVPVLVVTSETSLALEGLNFTRRPVNVIGKPVMPTELLRKVQTLLPAATPNGAAT